MFCITSTTEKKQSSGLYLPANSISSVNGIHTFIGSTIAVGIGLAAACSSIVAVASVSSVILSVAVIGSLISADGAFAGHAASCYDERRVDDWYTYHTHREKSKSIQLKTGKGLLSQTNGLCNGIYSLLLMIATLNLLLNVKITAAASSYLLPVRTSSPDNIVAIPLLGSPNTGYCAYITVGTPGIQEV